MKKINHSEMLGWGIDADPKNNPTYPYKNYTGDDHKRSNWVRPSLQHSTVEILKSNERPSKSAAFGTTSPPKGISGMIRRYAFKHSENRYRHWLPLLFADRVDEIEGILGDLLHARIPNIYKECGWDALWRFQKGLFFKKLLTRLLIVTIIVVLVICIVKND